MRNRKMISALLAGVLLVSSGVSVVNAAEEDLVAAQYEREAVQSGLEHTEMVISGLENKKQELENYLDQLNAEYGELTDSVSELGIEAARKEEELKYVKAELEEAKVLEKKQYEAMKIRIAYMYEKGGASMLELLFSSRSLVDFLNQAENISQLSKYDRDMLKKYEETCSGIEAKEQKIQTESAAISALLEKKAGKQREIQELADSTSSRIVAYIAQISENEAEASALLAQLNDADENIWALSQQIQNISGEEKEPGDDAVTGETPETEPEQEDPSVSSGAMAEYDPETDSLGDSSSSSSSSVIVEEYYEEDEETDDEDESYDGSPSAEVAYEEETFDVSAEEDAQEESYGEETYEESYEEESYEEESYEEESYEEESYEEESYEEESSSDSGSGTYLGNFTLTAYCNCAQCCGTAGNATASGVMPVAGHTVAMAGVPFGTQLLINGNVYTVEDLGTPYGHVDIYCDSHEEALSFGLQYADVYQLN